MAGPVAGKAGRRGAADIPRPQQRRSRRTQARILAAAEELLEAGRFDEASVQEIARRAGCSVGGFYGRFPDKYAVLVAFFDRLCGEAEDTTAKMLSPEGTTASSLDAILTGYVSWAVRNARRHLRLLRAAPQPATSPQRRAVVQRMRETNERAIQALGRLLERRREEVAHPQPKRAARMAVILISGTLREAMIFATHGTAKPPSDRALSRELSRTILAYLGVGDGR